MSLVGWARLAARLELGLKRGCGKGVDFDHVVDELLVIEREPAILRPAAMLAGISTMPSVLKIFSNYLVIRAMSSW